MKNRGLKVHKQSEHCSIDYHYTEKVEIEYFTFRVLVEMKFDIYKNIFYTIIPR